MAEFIQKLQPKSSESTLIMRNAFLQLHIAVLLAGLTGVMGRLISLNEGLLVWYRMFFTVLVLWLIHQFTRSKQASSSFALYPYLTGALVAIHWVFFYGSIKYSNVSIGLVCFSSVGFFTAILDPLVNKRSFDIREIALGILAITGISLMFHFETAAQTGILLGIISSLLATLFTVINKRLLTQYQSKELSRYELTGGWIVLTILLPVYLYFFPVKQLLPSAQDLIWLVILSVLCTVVAFHLSLNALKKISPFTVNLSYNLEPLYGILLAFILFKEYQELDKGFYFGLTLILLSVLLQSVRIWYKKTD